MVHEGVRFETSYQTHYHSTTYVSSFYHVRVARQRTQRTAFGGAVVSFLRRRSDGRLTDRDTDIRVSEG